MTPLVSVVLPCFNSAGTLPWALASLLAQTYEEWECIFVDDGSSDHPETVIALLSDERIRYFRSAKNVGRGAARRFAVEQARGKYVSMLDADDWLFPGKLDAQVRVMESGGTLALVSGGMAIVDREQALVGIRTPKIATDGFHIGPPMRGVELPPLPFAPVMLRWDIAKRYRFDGSFRMVEDTELLLRILQDHSYGALPTPLYVYSEYSSNSYSKMLSSSVYACMMFLRHWSTHPMSVAYNCLSTAGKAFLYTGAFAMGQADWSIRRRSRRPTEGEVAEFRSAQMKVADAAERLFGRPQARRNGNSRS